MSANVVNQRRVQAGSFTTTSTSYVDLLDNAAGNTIAVTITKAAGTDIFIIGSAYAFNASINDTMFLGVHDGTTDYDLGRQRTFSTANYQQITGARLITGLGAGTFTFKLRAKRVAASGTYAAAVSNDSTITAIECNSGALVASANTVVPAGNFTFTSTSYTDLLNNAGGTTIAVTVTKASGAATNLIVRGSLAINGAATGDTVTLGVHDGTTDTDIAEGIGDSSPHFQIVGEVALTGRAAGAYTLKLRVKTAGGQTQNFSNGVHSASIAVMEINA